MRIFEGIEKGMRKAYDIGDLSGFLDDIFVAYRDRHIEKPDWNFLVDRYSMYREFLSIEDSMYESLEDLFCDKVPEACSKEFFDMRQHHRIVDWW